MELFRCRLVHLFGSMFLHVFSFSKCFTPNKKLLQIGKSWLRKHSILFKVLTILNPLTKHKKISKKPQGKNAYKKNLWNNELYFVCYSAPPTYFHRGFESAPHRIYASTPPPKHWSWTPPDAHLTIYCFEGSNWGLLKPIMPKHRNFYLNEKSFPPHVIY